jgi:hypothetical protein
MKIILCYAKIQKVYAYATDALSSKNYADAVMVEKCLASNAAAMINK